MSFAKRTFSATAVITTLITSLLAAVMPASAQSVSTGCYTAYAPATATSNVYVLGVPFKAGETIVLNGWGGSGTYQIEAPAGTVVASGSGTVIYTFPTDVQSIDIRMGANDGQRANLSVSCSFTGVPAGKGDNTGLAAVVQAQRAS